MMAPVKLGIDPFFKTIEEFAGRAMGIVPALLSAILIFFLFFYFGKLVRTSVRRLVYRRRRGHNVAIVLGRLAQLVISLMGTFVASSILFPSVNAQTIIQVLGIGSVAVGFAFRDVLQNFLAGILILLNQPFRVGDQIRVKDFEGTVEDIQTRATFLKTYDGRRIVIPNASLFIDSVIVNTAFPLRRTEAIIGIGFGDDTIRAEEIILGAIYIILCRSHTADRTQSKTS